jgi:hypothetical protein
MSKLCPSITRTIVGAPAPATFQDAVEQLSLAISHVRSTTADRLFEITSYWFSERKQFLSALDILIRAELVEREGSELRWIGPSPTE